MYQARIYEVGTIVKLVTQFDIEAIVQTASNLLKYYSVEDIDSIDNELIYECYCKFSCE